MSATDTEVAQRVYRDLNLPLTRPIPNWFLQHTPDNHSRLDFYNINGIYRVVVLENEHRLRIENVRNNTWLFLEDIHASTSGDSQAPLLVRIWAVWNEAGIWLLLGFAVSGAWLWLTCGRDSCGRGCCSPPGLPPSRSFGCQRSVFRDGSAAAHLNSFV